MKKMNKSPLAAAMGVAFISTVAASAANAEANPFGMTELSSGYMQVAEMACGASMNMEKPKTPEGACAGTAKKSAGKATEGACGEGTCGAMMKDGKMKPGMEAACGAMMKGKEGACGAIGKDAAKSKVAPEGTCGEGTCGAMMKDGKMKPGMEAACGAMMKGKEGACGATGKDAGQTKIAPKDAAGK
jgi:uncharacterized low-complexity protein